MYPDRCEVGEIARSMVEVAASPHVSRPTGRAVFVELASTVAPATVLEIDETCRGKPRWIREAISDSGCESIHRIPGLVDLGGDQACSERTTKTAP
ncbi:hypothetical protein AXK61_00290 [Tsukamurella pseudospumae]|uniref:Uncharacterized protein n=1 Tax=Tsukamurella pseudospumae TaxID=239498 RepID=A0A137ZSZ3_9ACTN|nr:hypothetical protein AXK61_00290 [Tsukamurella pseudospumae]